MKNSLRLLCVFAHPDDETLATGGLLARYAGEGVETYLITATSGQRGWPGDPQGNPGPDVLGDIRRKELKAAAEILNLAEVNILSYMDGELDQVNPGVIIPEIAAHIQRIQPDVVITFDPFGVYGHPDHIAISQFTLSAIILVASSTPGDGDKAPPHRVSKLYYTAETAENLRVYEEAFGELVMEVDHVKRYATGWPDWAVTTRVDTSLYYKQVWQALYCHQSQLPGFQALLDLPEGRCEHFFSQATLYRVFSLVNGGREPETDLFTGLR